MELVLRDTPVLIKSGPTVKPSLFSGTTYLSTMGEKTLFTENRTQIVIY